MKQIVSLKYTLCWY